MPAMLVRLRDDRCRLGRRLGLAGDRIGFPQQLKPAGTEYVVFVDRARGDARQKQLPNPRLVAHAHGMPPAVP